MTNHSIACMIETQRQSKGVDHHNLKDAFRAQNKLQALMDEASSISRIGTTP